MKVELGGTRIVFIFSNIVVKIPRICVLRPFIRLFQYLPKKQVKHKLKAFDEKNILKAILKYISSGIYANRLEIYYSQKHKSNEMIFHVNGLFFGMILIQKKVEILDENDKRWKKFVSFLLNTGISDIDMLVSHNFGIENNQIKLIDYGKEATIKEIEKLSLNHYRFEPV